LISWHLRQYCHQRPWLPMAEKKPVAKRPVAKKPVAKPKVSAALQLAQVAARAADEKQGTNITVLNVGDVLAITELFVVATASNSRQVGAIQSEVSHKVREKLGRSPLRSEGTVEQQWVLIDYGDVVIHIFAQEARDFYEIERLYFDVPVMTWGLGD
jgi:ribosome-associated protein